MNKVNYRTLYLDFVKNTDQLSNTVKQQLLSILYKEKNEDIPFKTLIRINTIIRENISGYNTDVVKHRHRYLKVYDKAFVVYILSYQKENALTNRAMSKKFKLSRNTLSKWKDTFNKTL